MGDYSAAHVHASLPPPTPTPAKKSNKIRDIVRLQQMLKKWKKAATTKNVNNNQQQQLINDVAPAAATTNKTKTIGLNKFLKKTLSFSDISSSSSNEEMMQVRKGYLAVWVGRDHEEEGMKKKFVIPTEYLAHEAFSVLLRDAEEEFGFQQEGILKIPCDVPLFEEILKKMMTTTTTDNNKKQRPSLKSSSSTSSFFLYQQQQQQQQPHHHGHGQLAATPPTTPTHHLPLYCR